MFLADNTVTAVSTEEALRLAAFADTPVADLVTSAHHAVLLLSSEAEEITAPVLSRPVVALRHDRSGCNAVTGNLVGFIGCGTHSLTICSRFCRIAEREEAPQDYFLHYLLSKVFAFNFFDFERAAAKAAFLNLLFCLFPKFLNDALRQGIYRKYRERRFNDDKVRGSIEINRHLQLNLPANGNIAYKCRELSPDNDITQLIRHTVEFIREQKFGRDLLNKDAQTRSNVLAVVNATPSYIKHERNYVIKRNQKPVCHPFYTKYAILQKLCLAILKREDFKYAEDNKTCYGLIIDMAWLWEEYLATLLRQLKFCHPDNLSGSGAVYFGAAVRAGQQLSFNALRRYPDFYRKEEGQTIIIDAKYKNYLNGKWLDRNDINQMLAYLYGMKGKYAIILCPVAAGAVYRNKAYALSGWGRENNAKLHVIGFKVKEGFNDADDCRIFMEKSEQDLIYRINEFILSSKA